MQSPRPSRYRAPSDTRHRYTQQMLEKYLIKGDAMPDDSQLEQAIAGWQQGDPLADAWILESRSLLAGEGRKLLDKALNDGIDSLNQPPETLKALFTQLERSPTWLDERQLQLGAESYQRNPGLGLNILTYVSLMGGYVASSVIKPLMMTGRLSYKADKRLIETTQFTLNVTTPGQLKRYGEGFKAAVRVRIMHAMVRQMILENQDSNGWKMDDWGMPINQTDMLGTNMLFSFNYLAGNKALGCRYTDEESLAIMHLWRYVGYLMGIDEHRLPATEAEAARMLYLVNAIQDEPDQDSATLATALYEAPLHLAHKPVDRLLAPLKMHWGAGITRLFIGDEMADQLHIPGRFSKYLVPIQLPLRAAGERCMQLVPGATRWRNQQGLRYRQAYVERISASHKADYQAVSRLSPLSN